MSNWYVHTIGLWISLLAIFWLNFIIKVTEDCNKEIDCFTASGFPIEDCRRIVDFNRSIQCYEFQFDFINGAETAGVLLAISVTIVYGQLITQMWLKKKIAISKSKQKKKRFKILSILLGIVPYTLSIIFYLLSVIKFCDTGKFTAISNYLLHTVFYLSPVWGLPSYPLMCTDPEEDSPGPDSYTLMEDGHESINNNDTEEQPMRTRAHTTI